MTQHTITATEQQQESHPNFTIPLHNEDFLPSISRWTTLGGYFLLLAMGAAVGIAAFTPSPVAVRAPASVRPTGDLKVIQAGTEGAINRLEAEEGKKVSRGQILAHIDDSRLQTRRGQLETSIHQGENQIHQIKAQEMNLEAQISAEQNLVMQTLASAKADLLRAEREYADKKAVAEQERQEAELTVYYTKTQFDAFQKAAQAGAIAQLQVHEKQQNYLIAQSRLERYQALLNPTSASIAIAQEQVSQVQSKGQATLATLHRNEEAIKQEELQVQAQIEKDKKELHQVLNELQNTIIRAQVNGTILKIAIRNEGQIVRQGDVVAHIVPENTPLLVKAKVSPQDIGMIHMGQQVNMRVSAYTYTDYGTLKGKVIAIAADTIAPQSQNSADVTNNPEVSSAYFEVTIQPEQNYLIKDNQKYEIHPGMEVQADIVTNNETILAFILRKSRLILGF